MTPRFFFTILFCSLLALGLVFFTPHTQAQSEFISLSYTPRFPAPDETIEVSVTSRVENLNDNQIVWSQDGEVIASGVGITSVIISSGSAGDTTVVNFQTTLDGEVVERTARITPVMVDMIWEASESYTPPFYKGKALHPGWGKVTISAIPHIYNEAGVRYSPGNLVYTWRYNGLVYGEDSGRGESSFSVSTTPRQNNQVTLEIETSGGETVAEKSVLLPVTNPEVVFYKSDPLFGLQIELALSGEINLDSDTINLQAAPYFFLGESALATNLDYSWQLNGDSFVPAERKDFARLRQQSGVSGTARLQVEVDDESRIFPEAEANLGINF